MSKLTPKQATFFAEYLIDGNATRAAIAAGVPVTSASVQGSRWLKNSTIAAAIAERRAQRAKKFEITAERVLEEIAKLAFFDPGDLYDESGHLKPVKDMDEMTRAAIAGVDVEAKRDPGGIVTSMTKKIKLADKGQNLERLGKHLKLFTDLHEHSGRLTLEQLVVGGGETEEAA